MFNFFKKEKQIEFYYLDNIRIIKGFYKGHKGVIIAESSKNQYLVRLVTISSITEYINVNEMEKL